MDPITSTTNSAANALAGPQLPSTSADASKQTQSQFLQLLVAQLKEQDPLNPLQGNEFVAQLAQFSSLEELIKIRTSMGSVQDLLSKSTPAPNAQSGAAAPPTATPQTAASKTAA